MARGLVRPRAGYNLVAIYPELKQAREAVAHLERAGIEAGDISVVPKEAEDVEDTSLRDARVIGAISKRVLLVGTIAAIAGGFLGFFLGLAFFQWGRDLDGGGCRCRRRWPVRRLPRRDGRPQHVR
jgi:hypothetical protein